MASDGVGGVFFAPNFHLLDEISEPVINYLLEGRYLNHQGWSAVSDSRFQIEVAYLHLICEELIDNLRQKQFSNQCQVVLVGI